jgi:biotin carboxyl carrier protein
MSTEVTSPLAGTIWKILVKVGDTVNEDDDVIIIEALKMENTIYAPSSGTIKEIKVRKGDRVEDDQVLAIIE